MDGGAKALHCKNSTALKALLLCPRLGQMETGENKI
jgi:hypothetical protein